VRGPATFPDASRRPAARHLALAAAFALLALACGDARAQVPNYYYEPYWVEPDRAGDWYGSVSVGATYAQSQSTSYNLSLQGELERVTGSDRWSNRLLVISGRSDGNETAALLDARTRYSRDIQKRWFAFGQAEYRRDRPGNLERRTSVATGVGYRINEREWLSWSVLGGVGYTTEKFHTPLDIIDGPRRGYDRVEALVGTEVEFELTDNLTMTHRLSWYPNLSYSSAHRLAYDGTARAAITERLSLDITLSWRSSTEPGADKRPDELLLVTGISVRLD
jgi:putative salt-induced outer membrane protein